MTSARFARRRAILLLGMTLLIVPPPGTTARGRGFCRAWLALEPGERYEQLRETDRREAGSSAALGCREGLRARALGVLEAECRNWKQLMDFEVRALLDAVLGRCS